MTRVHTPSTIAEAVGALASEPDLVPVAGCTDLMVGDIEANLALPGVLDLSGVAELSGIDEEPDGVRIGAATTFTQIRRSDRIAGTFPALSEAAAVIGGWQIQNRATIGGNIANASPAGDSLPVLLVLDASVEVAGPAGKRLIPYPEFHTGYRETALAPGELLVAVHLPRPPAGARQFFRKVGTRQAQAISKVVVAMLALRNTSSLEEVRIAAGSVAPTPVRLRRAEATLTGARLDPDLADRAAELVRSEVEPIDDVRSTAIYRSVVLGRAVRRFLLELAVAPD